MQEAMFNRLKSLIGTHITCIYYNGNTEHIVEGILKDLTEYKSITINNITIPFLGRNIGINTISDYSNNVIYYNGWLNENYISKTEEELLEAKEKIFGKDYKEKLSKALSMKMTVSSNKKEK